MSVVDLNPRKLGSFEQYTLSLSRALVDQGGQSVVVFNKLPPDSLRPCFLEAGATVETKSFGAFDRNSANTLKALVRRYQPEVVHLHFVNLVSLDVVAAALKRGVKVVYSAHASDIPKQRTTLKWQVLRVANRVLSSLVNCLVAPSDYVKARLVREGVSAKKITTIHNGVSLETFRNVPVSDDIRRKYRIAPGTVIVTSISELIPEKGIHYLIDAAALVLGQGLDVAFIHVGDGPSAAEYRAKVQRLGIEQRFVFTGLLNLPEIAVILRESDIFTLPCTWGEAFSLTVLEALAAGKPAIVTRVGGNIEAVEDGRNGLLVPPRDAAALAAAITALRNNPERRQAMGRESTERSNYFSLDRWVNETISLYRRLCDDPTVSGGS